MNTLKRVNSALFDTTKAHLWEVLTQPQWTEKYMYNCRVLSTLEIGSSIAWRGTFQGTEMFLKGKVLAIKPHGLLKYSIVDPALYDDENPANYVHITYDIRPQNGKLLLTVINETFDGDEERMSHIVSGWEGFIFPGIEACI